MLSNDPRQFAWGRSHSQEVIILIDGDLTTTTWTTAEAAEACGVTAAVVYQWKRRGKITPLSRTGWPRYRALDVLCAEAATRERANRVHAAA